MCHDLSSTISQLQRENDEAQSLTVGVRPSSTLQQAPWWVKIPKQFTWLNLPDGVTDDQSDKDLSRMGIQLKPVATVPHLGLRTPSPETESRKRKRDHEYQHKQSREERRHFTLAEAIATSAQYEPMQSPPPPPYWNQWSESMSSFHEHPTWQPPNTSMMDSLLRVVEEDTRTHLVPPLLPPLPHRPPQLFTYNPLPNMPPGRGYMPQSREDTDPVEYYSTLADQLQGNRPPSLLPRPAQMPPEPFPETPYGRLEINTYYRYPNTNERRWSMASDYNVPRVMENYPHQSPIMRPPAIFPYTDMTPIPGPAMDSTHKSQSTLSLSQITFQRPHDPSHPTPKPIPQTPQSPTQFPPQPPPDPPKLTPIQPFPSTSRPKSHSPDLQRPKRPQSLLPKLSLFQQPPLSTPPPAFPARANPRDTAQPTFQFTEPSQVVHAGVPGAAPSMGRFTSVEYPVFPPNAKVAIARYGGGGGGGGRGRC